MSRIMIILKDGIIQDIYGTDADVDVRVIDLDTDGVAEYHLTGTPPALASHPNIDVREGIVDVLMRNYFPEDD